MTETRNLELDAAEAERHKAEAEWFRQQSAEKAMQAASTALAFEDLKLKHEKTLVDDWHSRVYRFNGPVMNNSVNLCIGRLAEWHRLDPTSPWTIVWNSPGGSVIDGMSLFDDVVAYSLRGGGTHQITTVVRGYAASMAGILLQSGDKRICGPESYILIHEVSTAAVGKVGEFEDEMKFMKMICDRVANLFVERSDGKISKATFKKHWERKDWWLDSLSALKYGFVDEVA